MEAVIIKLIAGDYTVYDASQNKIYIAKASGKFRHEKTTPKVGDKVVCQVLDENNAYITKIMPRENDLLRPFIANIDQAIVITSVKEPSFNSNLLDRFLTILSYNNIKAIIVFSKWDLLKEEEMEEMEKINAYYQKIGYQTYLTGNNLTKEIEELFKDKVSVITGQSGVGKSSLINRLDENLNLATSNISKALGRGKHTTRHTELHFLKGGLVADTPGFGLLEFQDMDEKDIAQNFVEFFNLSDKCKYKGCLHINEPSCKVKEALLQNEILKSRYDNYLQFINEIKKQRKW